MALNDLHSPGWWLTMDKRRRFDNKLLPLWHMEASTREKMTEGLGETPKKQDARKKLLNRHEPLGACTSIAWDQAEGANGEDEGEGGEGEGEGEG